MFPHADWKPEKLSPDRWSHTPVIQSINPLVLWVTGSVTDSMAHSEVQVGNNYYTDQDLSFLHIAESHSTAQWWKWSQFLWWLQNTLFISLGMLLYSPMITWHVPATLMLKTDCSCSWRKPCCVGIIPKLPAKCIRHTIISISNLLEGKLLSSSTYYVFYKFCCLQIRLVLEYTNRFLS